MIKIIYLGGSLYACRGVSVSLLFILFISTGSLYACRGVSGKAYAKNNYDTVLSTPVEVFLSIHKHFNGSMRFSLRL